MRALKLVVSCDICKQVIHTNLPKETYDSSHSFVSTLNEEKIRLCVTTTRAKTGGTVDICDKCMFKLVDTLE